MCPTAIMVDGGFFLKRYEVLCGRHHSAEEIAKTLFTMCLKHLDDKNDLYRILFYDCPPLSKKAHHPVTGELIDFSETTQSVRRNELHRELVKLRKVALRRGRLADRGGWVIKPATTKAILADPKAASRLTEQDVYYDMVQKGVDMRIGLDVASIAYKRLAKRIVLITGDADFVPVAKFARREGMDVILDPMWNNVSPDLLEHTDGVEQAFPKPKLPGKKASR